MEISKDWTPEERQIIAERVLQEVPGLKQDVAQVAKTLEKLSAKFGMLGMMLLVLTEGSTETLESNRETIEKFLAAIK